MVAVVGTARGRVEVDDAGLAEGPALLVVHGLPGDYRQGITLLEDLGSTARVLRVSRPGYGRTPLSSGRSVLEQGDLYAALLDALGIDSAVVVGISGGGPSAYAFAARHPSRCAGLVLCCAVAPHAMELPVGMKRLAAVPGVWPLLAAVTRGVARVRPPAASTEGLTPAELALVDEHRPALERFTRDTPTWTSGRGMRNDVRGMDGHVSPSGVTAKTVVLHGDADPVVPVTCAHAYLELVPHATLEVLPGLGHAVPLFARSPLTERVRELLPLAVSSGRGRRRPGRA